MKNRRNAVLWALGWWLVRRQLRRRAAVAVAGATGAAARRGRLRAVLGALGLVALVAGALVAWRKLSARPEPPAEGGAQPPEPAPPPEPAAA